MRFWRSIPGAFALVLLLGMGVAVGAVSVQVHRLTHPARVARGGGSLAVAGDLVRIESDEFPAADGVPLRGWRIAGPPGSPGVVLCHDLGSSKEAMLGLALALQSAGFTVVAFDFRGHGESGGAGSTLGVEEKRDVLGAIDYLAGVPGVDARRLGVYGVGMGAQAAVRAASDRRAAAVLVLDGLYPDVGWEVERAVYGQWRFKTSRLGFLPRSVFEAMHFGSRGEPPASQVLPTLRGRHLLLVAPADDAALAAEMQRMYEAIPEQKDADGNLVTLPAGSRSERYGEDLALYHHKVLAFFRDRLLLA
jgi:pimeloyl-ACP methyl ester carboxylesterase